MATAEMKAGAAVAKAGEKVQGKDPAEDLIGRLVAQARDEGLDVVGEGGLLQQLTSGCWNRRWKVRSATTWAMTSTRWR